MKYQLISSLEQTVEASTYYRYLPKPKPPRKTTLGVHVFIVLLVLIHSLFLLWQHVYAVCDNKASVNCELITLYGHQGERYL